MYLNNEFNIYGNRIGGGNEYLGGAVSFEMADEKVVKEATSAKIGFAGPLGIKVDTLLVDEEVSKMYNFIIGANDTGYHYINVNYGRDFEGKVGDFRRVVEGDKCPKCGKSLTVAIKRKQNLKRMV